MQRTRLQRRLRQAWLDAYDDRLVVRLILEARYLTSLERFSRPPKYPKGITAAEMYPEVVRLRLKANLVLREGHRFAHMYTTRERRALVWIHLTPKQRATRKRTYSLREHKKVDEFNGYRVN